MGSPKASYKLNELEKGWKEFKPSKVTNTGLSKMLKFCGTFDLKVLKTQNEAKRWADYFNEVNKKIGEIHKLDPIKKDKNAQTFLDRAGNALSAGPDTKILWQIVAGNRTYNKDTKEWELSASIKKQTGQG